MDIQARNWKRFLLLSMIVPIGLFTALRLSGIGQPATVETIRLDAVNWVFNRPTGTVLINKELNTTFDDTCLMTFSTILGTYCYDPSFPPNYFVTLASVFTVSSRTRDFQVRDVWIVLKNSLGQSQVDLLVPEKPGENLSIVDYNVGGAEAYVHLVGTGSPDGASCRFESLWNIYSPVNMTEERGINFEVTYYDGTAYSRVIQPFVLTLVGS